MTYGTKTVLGRAIACATCLWWSPGYANPGAVPAKGQCRRNPPTVTRGDAGIGALWPTTVAQGWCGEHATEDKT